MNMYKTCLNCSKEFEYRRYDATTCSPACRMALSRRRKRLAKNNIESLPPQAIAMLNDLKGVSVRSYRRIVNIVKQTGAQSAEQAIYAAYEAASDCIVYQEAEKQRSIREVE